MSYRFKTTEYALTSEEQEQARFLLATANHHNAKVTIRRHGMSGCELEVFEAFRRQFYFGVQRRLEVNSMSGWSLSEDATKVYHTSVVKAESYKKKEAK